MIAPASFTRAGKPLAAIPAVTQTPCPKCEASAGEFCRTTNGHRTSEHSARIQAHIAAQFGGAPR
ncbi:zinc finger domain-containing protein [Phenylobacterium sp. VNQ135]|uniref:zinc finger domain-containing protein n=1 Tax=Phenylobacterium sp. VNQ135 TaxID=3400922 RepID=UPI003C0A6CC4